MDQAIRNKLRSVVTQCRKLLEESVAQQLQGKYDIFVTGKKDEVRAEKDLTLAHLSSEEHEAREDILAHFDHITALGYKPKEALEQLIREIAFTHLNRLCAYKMMEVRDVYVGGQRFREAVSKGLKSQGFLFYLAAHPEDERRHNAGHQDVAYRHFLNWLGGTLSQEIGVLFSPSDPANRVYPPQRVLDDVLELINSEELKGIWSEDETIGWVYQYFTPKELRDQARKECQAPRNSYELAFRNQFFTPRYVVEFLTDNTLGRIWYEMRKGETKLKDQCRYMVRRATEVFLGEGEQPPKDDAADRDDLPQEDLLKLPVYMPHRPMKDPRELKVLDPACGSGHFLLYCFALLLVIYEEAFDDPNLGPALRADYPTKDDLNRALPSLILRRNLHGIDIDVRAVQIAGLALWLRCQRAYHEMGLKAERPPITKSNVVCAEPMPGEKELLDEFLKTLRDDHLETLLRQVMHVAEGTRVRGTKAMADSLSELIRAVWEKMRLAGEAGSLLEIEQDLQEAIRKGQEEWEERMPLFRHTEFGMSAEPKERFIRFVPGDVEAEPITFWDRAEGLVRNALDGFVQFASSGGRFERQLFVEDAKQGLGFVDVCRQCYDVVLMNPPFGVPARLSKAYVERTFPRSKNDIYASFVERSLALSGPGAMVGAITSRSGFFMSSFRKWREEILLQEACLFAFADLGHGVLDSAMVETAAYCIRKETYSRAAVFFRLINTEEKSRELRKSIAFISKEQVPSTKTVMYAFPKLFQRIPGTPFAYWVGHKIRDLFGRLSPLEGDGRSARVGLQTSDNFRFVRLWTEVTADKILTGTSETTPEQFRRLTWAGRRWVPYAKGGSFSRFFSDLHMVVNWERDGEEIKEWAAPLYGNSGWSRIVMNHDLYFNAGITWSLRSQLGFSSRALNAGSIFGHKGPAILAPKDMLLSTLSNTNSNVFQCLLSLQMAFGSYEVGVLQRTPIGTRSDLRTGQLVELAGEAVRCKQQISSFDETAHLFAGIGSFNIEAESLAACTSVRHDLIEGINRELEAIQNSINVLVADSYGLTESDLKLCEENQAGAAFDAVRDSKADDSEENEEVVAGFPTHTIVSYFVGCVLGRWEIRSQSLKLQMPRLPDPFTPLPACSPGMLQGSDGLPATTTPSGYPIRIDWDGILVDDSDHADDIIRRVRDVLEVIWKDCADAIEKEACEILGEADLRGYFRRPGAGGFWDDHVKRYSKSRRKAPIYWLLQSSKKNYALWIYYHRLDKDIFFKALLNYVEPKVRKEESRLNELRSQKTALGPAAKGAKKIDKDVDRQESFLSELRDFEDKLRRAANLNLEPDLNDGVVLNIAPLHELVPWKEAKNYWEELLEGKYEWSSIGKQLREKGIVTC